MKDHRAGRVLPARAAAEDSDAIEVVIGIFCRGGLVPEDAIGETSITEVMPADVVKGLGTKSGSHGIHLHDDEAQIGEVGRAALGAKSLGNVSALGTVID